MISTIRKRDGKLVPYDNYKIANAIFKAASAAGAKDFGLALYLAKNVEESIGQKFHPNSIPAVEEIQDIVEKVLIEQDTPKLLKHIFFTESSTGACAVQKIWFWILPTQWMAIFKGRLAGQGKLQCELFSGGLILTTVEP